MKFVGHCWRSKEQILSQLLLWQPAHGSRPRRRPTKSCMDQLETDTGLGLDNLPTAMEDRELWILDLSKVPNLGCLDDDDMC